MEQLMRIALTGATGFIGRYLARRLAGAGHTLRCWRRAGSDVSGMEPLAGSIEWLEGALGDEQAGAALVRGCDAVVHSALYHVSRGFERSEGDVVPFVQKNIVGTIQLMETARQASIGRFVFISTCAVYDKILPDRPLDETHPLWPRSHYGAHKAALEKFVHSFAADWNYPICALRPTGVYGLAHPPQDSKWFDLVQAVVRGEALTCDRGGKEVHASDVAQAVELLLTAPLEKLAGEAFNCCDLYVSQWDVAHLAKQISGSQAEIRGRQTAPKNQIVTKKLQALGMTFGGKQLLEETVRQLVAAAAK
jgi:nucleoside-diphosphate-sugar epimerase